MAVALSVFLVASAFAGAASAVSPACEVTAVAAAPPADLAFAVRDGLGTAGGLHVALAGEPLAEIWLNGSLAVVGEGGSSGLGVAYPGILKGGLVGAIRLLRQWIDYRGSRVAPGIYTLRYAVEPADGAHMGVSLYRDFLLLVPAAADDGRPAWAAPELIEASRKATGGAHPPVLALFPPSSAEGAPRLVENEIGQPTLITRAGSVALGLVLAGRGDLP